MINKKLRYNVEEDMKKFFGKIQGKISFKNGKDNRSASSIDRESIFKKFEEDVIEKYECEVIRTGANKFPDSAIFIMNGFNFAVEYKTKDDSSEKSISLAPFNTTFPTEFKKTKCGKIYRVYYFFLNIKNSIVQNSAIIYGGYFSPYISSRSIDLSGEEKWQFEGKVKIRRRRQSSYPPIKVDKKGFYTCFSGNNLEYNEGF
jgi:hypothetical protein